MKELGNGQIALELCAGLGGIGIGLRAVGFHIAKAYDSWAEAVAIYNHNAPDPVASTCNLLSGDARRSIGAFARSSMGVDLLAAGPPCKGFSQLRNGFHDGRNGHNRVLAAIPEYVAILRPQIVLIENVPDLARHRDGATLSDILKRLASPCRGLRYRVEYQTYDAALFGVPQVRRRMLILAVRNGCRVGRLPQPAADLTRLYAALRHEKPVPAELRPFLQALDDPEDQTLTSAQQALSDLPRLGPGEPEIERRYRSTPKNAYQRWVRTGAAALLRDTQTPAVRPETMERLKHVAPGGCARKIPDRFITDLSRRYDSAYRRLHPRAPSTALSTKYDCVYHYDQARSLSVREYARLQGLPDSVTFPQDLACRRSAYEMVGNSVPPLLIEHVLRHVLGSSS